MDEDEVQVSARIELTPPTAKPSLRPTIRIRTELPTESPVFMTDNIFEEAEFPSSGSQRARIKYQLLLASILSPLVIFFQQ